MSESEKLPEPPPNQWYGDSTNGIEFRYFEDGTIDEALLYIDGVCVFHMEAMSDTYFWFRLYCKTHQAHLHVSSKNGRSYVQASGDGWSVETAAQQPQGD